MARIKEATGDERLHKALMHPMRVRILLILEEKGPHSPNQLSKILDESLNLVAYHVRVLEKYELIELVDTKQRRGATEHFYALTEGTPVVGVTSAISKLLSEDQQTPQTEFLHKLLNALGQNRLNGKANTLGVEKFEADDAAEKEVETIVNEAKMKLAGVAAKAHQRITASGSERPRKQLRVGLAVLTEKPPRPSAEADEAEGKDEPWGKP
jgi:predicted ArsR family transcriptional regulator